MTNKSYHCANCTKLLQMGDSVFGVLVGKEFIESDKCVEVVEEVVCRLYCVGCEQEVNLSCVVHPDFKVNKRGWGDCQICEKEAEAGDTIWAVSNLNGSIDARGLQIYSSDSLWIICLRCGERINFRQIEVLCRD